MAQKCAIGLISALAASASLAQSKVAAADGPFTFSGFSTSSPSVNPHKQQAASPPPSETQKPPSTTGKESSAPPRARNDNPRTSSGGFDPEALERGAKALKEINNSSYAKKVLKLFCSFSLRSYEFCVLIFSETIESCFGLGKAT